ncbi:hypothetical protein HDV00_003824 [Rhizophlyctis rosea]|nr:hypothetical protein HDV00_003824 [Rhizophlyctis rosea]
MSAIDLTIAEADKFLANVDLRQAFSLYFDAVSLITAHIRSNTEFEVPTDDDPHAYISSPAGPMKFKNWVVKQPEDIERLFGLAHLCLTEVEDIINGEISADDLDPYGDDDGQSVLGSTVSSDAKRLSTDQLSINSKEFRDHRLSRPRSIRSVFRTTSRRHQSLQGTMERLKLDREAESSPENKPSILDEGRRAATPEPEIQSSPEPIDNGNGLSNFPHHVMEGEEFIGNNSWEASAHKSNESIPQDDVLSLSDQYNKPAEAVETPSGIGPEYLPSPPRLPQKEDQSTREWGHTRSGSAPLPKSPPPQSETPPFLFFRGHDKTPMSSIKSYPASIPSMDSSSESFDSASDRVPSVTSPTPTFLQSLHNPMQDTYLPLIPASPLICSQQQSYDQYTQTTNQLRTLQENQMARARTPSAASAQASEALSQIRRGMETSTVLKDRLAAIGAQITAVNGKTLFSFTCKQVAVQLTAFDWEMFGFITLQDFMQFASTPSQPAHSIKSSLDFGYYVRRLVQITIVTPEDLNLRARIMNYWIDTAAALFRLHNFQSLAAVVSGLVSPPIARLTKSWHLVPKKVRAVLDDFVEMLGDAEGFRRYRLQIERSGRPAMPWLIVLLADALTQSGFANARAQLEWFKGCDFREVTQEKNPNAAHWLVSQPWMSEDQVMKNSVNREVEGKDKKTAKKQAEAMTGRGVAGASHAIYGRAGGDFAGQSSGSPLSYEVVTASGTIEASRGQVATTEKKAKAVTSEIGHLMDRLNKLKKAGIS